MKKTYKSIATFIVLLSMLTLKMGAQLSGVVTINALVPTSVTNYTSFTALATALNTGGVSGPLTVNVVANSGPYTEQPSFNVISGVSATNTITVNGNGNTLTFSSASSATPWTLNLNGADRMYFNNLNMIGTGTYAYVCLLSAGADFNTFSACTFSNPVNVNSTTQYPVIFSGINSGVSASNSGNFCTFKNCSMLGGWYGIYMYGNTGTPYQTNNTIDKCIIRDYYYMGVYCYYQKNPTVRDCISDRPTRTANYSTIYGYYLYASQGAMFERNKSTQLFDAQQTTTTGAYGIFFAYTPVTGSDLNTLRNNVVCDIKSNGLIYGIYGYYPNGYIYHNTVSLDHTGATAGTTYGLYMYGLSGYTTIVKNNLVTVTRGGTGTKYCYYSGGTTGNITLDKNNYYMNSAAGTNNLGYYTGAATNLAALQLQGVEPNGMSVDPVYSGLPTTVIPTSSILNNQGTPLGIVSDYQNNVRSSTTPDIGAYEFLQPACVGTPTAGAVTTPTSPVCPGTILDLSTLSYNSDAGVTYQWVASNASAVGPWTVQPGYTTPFYTTNAINQPMWYGLAMTCANAPGSNTVVGAVTVAGTTTMSVPYVESFEGITRANDFPNCSWSATNLLVSTATYTSSNTQGRTPRTGTKFAAFLNSGAGVNYFYTNGIYLNAGITYSASVWYQTEYYGYTNWTDLSLVVGTSQTPTGQSLIASTNGPAVSNVYKRLTGNFTVTTSGIYYVGVKATMIAGSAPYLAWDDLSIGIPCSANSPTVSLSVNATTICANEPVTLNAGGADTYTWNTGANTNIITEYPSISTNYVVVGTHALSGCSATLTQMVMVNPTPVVLIYSTRATICAGESTNLSALGTSGISYMWSNNASGANITVSPASTVVYTLSGTSALGCTGMATQQVSVQTLPAISAVSSQPNEMCSGDVQTLTGNGGVSYVWVAGSGLTLIGNPVNINPTSTTVYTVTGTNAAGCSNKSTVVQNVGACTGLAKLALSSVNVYPNPTSGMVSIELNNSSEKTVIVMDLTGRVISSNISSEEVVKVNLSNLSNGVYYVKIQSSTSTEVVKIVKN